MNIRHRIEEKNGELKEAHGLCRADSRGLFAMELQMYFTAFAANVKYICCLYIEKRKLPPKKWGVFRCPYSVKGFRVCI